MGGLADVLDRGDEALGTRIEKMLGQRPAVIFAPLSSLEVFLWREASRFAEGYEPDRESRMDDSVEDAIELTTIMLPYGVVSHEVCFSGPV